MELLRKILFPFSLVYGFVVYLRNLLFDYGIFHSKSYKTPVICVGNLSVGGTGKTPMIELLISIMTTSNKIAVISRGYKRKSKGFILATSESTPELIGDEPFQIYSKFPEITLAIDSNRNRAIAFLEKSVQPDVILLDDAFQHRKVKPAFSILLTTCDNLYSEDYYLPSGNLRDSRSQARRADLIIITKCPKSQTKEEQKSIIEKLNTYPKQKVLFSYLEYNHVFGGSGSLKKLSDLKNSKINLLTGIANPEPLVQFLKQEQIEFEHIKYSDHHFFSPAEMKILKTKKNLLTTEKDFVRLNGEIEACNYIRVKHKFFEENSESLKKILEEFMSQYSS